MDGHFTLPRTSRRVFLQHANVKMRRGHTKTPLVVGSTI